VSHGGSQRGETGNADPAAHAMSLRRKPSRPRDLGQSAQRFRQWLATAERPIDKHFRQNELVVAVRGRQAFHALHYDLRSFGEPFGFAVQNVAGLVPPAIRLVGEMG
jgi:hypothetical protein